MTRGQGIGFEWRGFQQRSLLVSKHRPTSACVEYCQVSGINANEAAPTRAPLLPRLPRPRRDEMEEKCMAADMAPQAAETRFTLIALFPAQFHDVGRDDGHSVKYWAHGKRKQQCVFLCFLCFCVLASLCVCVCVCVRACVRACLFQMTGGGGEGWLAPRGRMRTAMAPSIVKSGYPGGWATPIEHADATRSPLSPPARPLDSVNPKK
jgi:hypothetical protein